MVHVIFYGGVDLKALSLIATNIKQMRPKKSHALKRRVALIISQIWGALEAEWALHGV